MIEDLREEEIMKGQALKDQQEVVQMVETG